MKHSTSSTWSWSLLPSSFLHCIIRTLAGGAGQDCSFGQLKGCIGLSGAFTLMGSLANGKSRQSSQQTPLRLQARWKKRASQAPSQRHGKWAFAMFRLTTNAILPYLSISTVHRTNLSLINIGAIPGRRWLMVTNTRLTWISRDQ